MPEATRSRVLEVSINGAVLRGDDALLLIEGWVDFAAGVPGAFQLTFRDEDREALRLVNAEIGAPVVLTAVSGPQRTKLLTGEITGLETDYDGQGSFSIVRGYDAGHRLLRKKRVAGYRGMNAALIAQRLLADAGVPAGRIGPTPGTYPYITQAGVSDWDFLCRLADENNVVMSVDADGKFQFAPAKRASGAPAAGSPLSPADNPRELRGGQEVKRCRSTVTASDQVARVEVRGWDVSAKSALTEKASARAANKGALIGTTPGTALAGFKPAKEVELARTDTPFDNQRQVKKAAEALADDVTGAFAEVEVCVHGEPTLRPGVPVTLTDVGKPFEGKYTVTGARHVYAAGAGYETWVTVTGRQWRSFYGLASGGGDGFGGRLPSVANALVTDVQDPLRQGRVKLRFPWLDDTYISDWTRTVQYGGVQGGGLITPSVNDEVLVAFDRGALDHPYVIGSLYNGRDKPGRGDVQYYDKLGRVVRRTLADRANNRLDLLDQPTMRRKRGVRLSTGDEKLTVHLDRTRTEITVDSKGAVSITGGTDVTVKAGRALTLQAGGPISMRSGGAITLTAATRVQTTAPTVGLTGSTTVSISGAATDVKSSLVNVSAGAVNVVSAAALSLQATAAVSIRGATIPLLGLVTANGKPVI
ncbi:VgrG-related protein [Streptomyces sp. F63]|uniref:VgrG-related protein n=1 Tax=Streptomyces sp. F63 TaxID=2824887 RepID=UPI001B37F640|nr:VgrG-related protein [Streptomyces sp. F63]MBQ0983519.1 VgrG-related protein [Streptomyces sp. F63]